jgi:hypothetical protein
MIVHTPSGFAGVELESAMAREEAPAFEFVNVESSAASVFDLQAAGIGTHKHRPQNAERFGGSNLIRIKINANERPVSSRFGTVAQRQSRALTFSKNPVSKVVISMRGEA